MAHACAEVRTTRTHLGLEGPLLSTCTGNFVRVLRSYTISNCFGVSTADGVQTKVESYTARL